jgi:glycerophosphoryl diester phosphodiesterase
MIARPASLDVLTARPFAHRGLHRAGVPENSLAAARAAMAQGFGIECDVRLSSDGLVHVFHDTRLERLTDGQGCFAALNADDITALRLTDGDEPIPRLSTLLALTGEHTPLLIEIKSDGGPRACALLCAAVARDLAHHAGPVGVMSFDPLACHWFARHRPQILRGLVVSRRYRTGIVARRGTALAIAHASPHFIACDVHDLPRASAFPGRLRRPLLCWTVRSEGDSRRAARSGAQIIFESWG